MKGFLFTRYKTFDNFFLPVFLQSYLKSCNLWSAFMLVIFLCHSLKKKSKPSDRSSPPTKLPWNHESYKAHKFHLPRSDEHRCQKPLVCQALHCLSTRQAACQRLRQESQPETQQESVRALPQLCWNENGLCKMFSKPASSNEAARWLVTLRERTTTEVVLSYILMKKVFYENFPSQPNSG